MPRLNETQYPAARGQMVRTQRMSVIEVGYEFLVNIDKSLGRAKSPKDLIRANKKLGREWSPQKAVEAAFTFKARGNACVIRVSYIRLRLLIRCRPSAISRIRISQKQLLAISRD